MFAVEATVSNTIKSSRDIDAMFECGKRGAGRLLLVLARKTPSQRGPEGRVAFAAGRKLGNAVFRNRAKRVLRASVKRTGGPWPTWDVVLIARAGVDSAAPAEVDSSLREALSKAGVLQ